MSRSRARTRHQRALGFSSLPRAAAFLRRHGAHLSLLDDHTPSTAKAASEWTAHAASPARARSDSDASEDDAAPSDAGRSSELGPLSACDAQLCKVVVQTAATAAALAAVPGVGAHFQLAMLEREAEERRRGKEARGLPLKAGRSGVGSGRDTGSALRRVGALGSGR